MSLQREIRQTKPFGSLAEEAFLNIWRTAEVLFRAVGQPLKPHGITLTQYNALRVLRGAEPDGLTCRELGERMISQDPDVTRLLDRLSKQGLVTRRRSQSDRRVVTTRITPAGLALMARLDGPMPQVPRRMLDHLGEADLRRVIRLLEQARNPNPEPEEQN
jgi:DNA-binding MarR family transcriptional regulator